MKPGKIITEDDEIKRTLENAKTIAIVGLSPNKVAKYLKNQGYRIIPVRPGQKEILGEKAHATLDDIQEKVDIVDVFRNSAQIVPHALEAARLSPKVFWMQLNIENPEAAALLTEAGVDVVTNKCIKIEHEKLCKKNAL